MSTLRPFVPPACPYRVCPAHSRSRPPDFFRPHGSYRTRLPDGSLRDPVPRYRCRLCLRTFSDRTFSPEFRLHRPDLTRWALEELVSSVSLRQSGRLGILSRGSMERRLDRFGLHCRRLLRLALRTRFPRSRPALYLLDELETFEQNRRRKPLTVPFVIEHESRYTLTFAVASLASRIPRRSRLWRPSKRRDRSRVAVRRCFTALAKVAARGSVLRTDRKLTYPALLRMADPEGKIRHERYSGKLPRGHENPLFAVNHLLAMTRDGLSRLRRRTWCHAKKAQRLWKHLAVYLAWKNFVRARFNGEALSAAQRARVTGRRWSVLDLVAYRQDLGPASPDPF